MAGTLGCYVQAEIKDRWELFGLTNYHVVRHAFEGAQVDADNAHPPLPWTLPYIGRTTTDSFRTNFRNLW